MKLETNLPVAVIGAGPVGLAAAAHLVSRGLTPIVFERGASVGASLLDWGHVRVFSPWEYNVDGAARSLLEAAGWDAPELTELPTGRQIVEQYLEPLAGLPTLAPCIKLSARVTAITRVGLDKVSNRDRERAPFEVRWTDANGNEQATVVRAVIDASGTWKRPNPMGVDGLPVLGERAAADFIDYGIPDVLGGSRESYANKTVLVVGSGHSAINIALALLSLQDQEPGTRVLWALRRNRIERLLGGGLNDQLPERGALGLAAKKAIDTGRLQVLAPFAATRLEKADGRVAVVGTLNQTQTTLMVDRIVVATGFRPDLDMLSELRVSVDPATEAPPALSPLIDPNFHSCGTVPPHGVVELTQPEANFFIIGSKSYGRAPTFLMATGFEQARSVVAELAGDHVAAREVHLALPETGVCSVSFGDGSSPAASSCCGTPAPVTGSSCCGGPATSTSSCCAADEVTKAEGEAGCGCATGATPDRTTINEAEPA
ncbi:NAD(P)-binding domain-containing protein [Devosia sp. ZB163]|uniref:NAD(P)-binding domain-containing protein n=1 Tax=Devosia sp. ZB163 TaxID=3025938 RepID=UPI002360506E|nr:NAD(P)-binding domain-containing protein [Devosia sp. ZB163]MDC9823974.1 NAD(P)-binding domain-containing protein [Devosia sp. ZB163]